MYKTNIFKFSYTLLVLIIPFFLLSCADTSNNQPKCVVEGCNYPQTCNIDTGFCELPPKCSKVGCEVGKVCNTDTESCEISENCLEARCKDTEYCDTSTRKCKDNCYEGKCIEDEICNNLTGLCESKCKDLNCQDNFICDPIEIKCKPECLNNNSCEVTEHCNETTGVCDNNCPENKCATNQRCIPLTGECEFDCNKVTCQDDNQLCDSSDGVCKIACEVNKCQDGENCNQNNGLCEETILSQYKKPCTESSECLSGLCIEVQDIKVCSLNCELLDECGDAWNCFPNNNESICAPIQDYSCNTCQSDTDCSPFGGKCIEVNGINSCVDSCEFSNNCNEGFTCNNIDIAGDNFKLCTPNSNSCDCNSENIDMMLNCKNTNSFGTCNGKKTCTENGWSECGGKTASKETCNNIDNNCDGIVDNIESSPCNQTNELGTCNGVIICQSGLELCTAKIPIAERCNGVDDNCNNQIDELDDLGCRTTNDIGSCQGLQICEGSLGWGQCTAIEAVHEVCDGLDNDCNDEIDDNLDNSCQITNEFGTCTGTKTCLGAEGWDNCDSINPSPEVCDGIDNNCNGNIDEDNENLLDNCSNIVNAEVNCSNNRCNFVKCNENFYNIDNDSTNGCEYSCEFLAFQDLPDGIDQNCDGIDGSISNAIFVSTRIGDDNEDGSILHPLKSINFAISRAVALNKTQILVARGDYNETIIISNGISLFGGYNDTTWTRDINSNISKINTSATGISCVDITQETFIDGFTINAGNAVIYPENSIAINIKNSGSNLKLKNLKINAGNGLKGMNGGQIGTPRVGENGGNGDNGENGDKDRNTYDNDGGNGGVNSSCPIANGGKGGEGGEDNNINNTDYDGYPGSASASGVSGGTKGTRGDPGNPGGVGSTSSSSSLSGSNGLNTHGFGEVVAGTWIGSSSNAGNTGNHGAGGGGGGGGGGQYCNLCNNGSGNGGGGGAAGGCGGAGGFAGTSGTGSFGIFMTNSSPVITNVELSAGFGGNGGNGGEGAQGGNPGLIGYGATASTSQIGAGGNGGAGKSGGKGGYGAGGSGGVSYCIYRYNSTPELNSWTCDTSLGGTGGTSIGNSGSTGESGDLY